MMDSGVYDDSIDLCVYSDTEEYDNLRIADDHCLGKYAKVNLKNIKMGSEANLFTDACLLSRAERALRQVRDSYNDLRIKEETITHGRSDLGPLTGRFDKACRLSKSYYFGKSSNYDIKEINPTSDFKKVSLSGLNLDCGSFAKSGDDDDLERLTGTPRKREDFVESLKKLFNSQLSKYGSATGSLCSMTSSDYSSWSNDKSGREESADESNDFMPTEETTYRNDCDVAPRKSASFIDLKQTEDIENLDSKTVEVEVQESERTIGDLPKDEGIKEDSRVSSNKPERRIELDIEETMPKLNWDFLEQQLEKAILKEKSVSSQLRDEILRKMAHEAKNDEEDDDDAGNSNVDRSKIYRLSCGSCDDLSVFQQPLPTFLSSAANASAVTTLTSTATTAGFKGVSPLFRRPLRKSKISQGPNNQLQVCFVNELSLEEDEASAATTLTTPGDTFDRHVGPSHHHHQQQQQLFPPSEYSTLNSETFRGEDCDGKSLGLASQTTRHSSDSCKSSLHPIPALNCLPRSLVDVEDNFFTKQARLQAEARIALAQVRPMSYMQFLLEKQVRKEASNVLQYDLPGINKWSDLRAMYPQRMGVFNVTHLKIIINHFLSEITHLNEELMNLLLERDDMYIVQDSMLVDIEDFTRRAEEWEYKKLIGSRQGMVTPPSSPLVCSSPLMSSGSVLGKR